MIMLRAIVVFAAVAAAAGCSSKEGPAQVPKNPVPMEKPGPAAAPDGPPGGKAANPQGGEQAQPLPK
jgi:hypothetical protein